MKRLFEIEIDTEQACSLAQWDSVLGRRYCVHDGEYCEGDLTKRPSHCCLVESDPYANIAEEMAMRGCPRER